MTTYTATIELPERGTPTDTRVDQLHDALGAYHVALSTSPHGWLTVTITLPGENLAQATQTALAVATAAVDRDPVSVTIMTEAEADERNGFTHVPDLIGVPEAAEILGVTPQRALQMVNEGKLAAHRIGKRGIAIVRDEVIARASRERIQRATK